LTKAQTENSCHDTMQQDNCAVVLHQSQRQNKLFTFSGDCFLLHYIAHG